MSVTFENVEELISEYLLRLDRVGLKLGRGVPEIGKELWEYWKNLSGTLNPERRRNPGSRHQEAGGRSWKRREEANSQRNQRRRALWKNSLGQG